MLTELTGLSNVYMEQVGAFGEVERDPGERVVSIAYSALINITEDVLASTQYHSGCWVPVNELPPLGFDHPKMIAKARRMMKLNFATAPVAFNLLPEYFTLSQLQPCIVPTEKIDKTCSRRGARLHRYDAEAYSDNPKFKI